MIFLGLNFVTISLNSSYVKKSIFGPVSGGTLLGPLFLFSSFFSLVFCFSRSNVQTLGSNGYGQHSLLVSHKRTRIRNILFVIPFKTGRNLKRGDLSETDKDNEHLPCLSARPRLPAAEMPGVACHTQTSIRNTSFYQPKTGCGHLGSLYLSLLAPSCSFSLPVCCVRGLGLSFTSVHVHVPSNCG